MILECKYDTEPGHRPHEFPDDWVLGGPLGNDPRADPRWRGTTYSYLDDRLREVHWTQVPLCDDQALDEFTKVANFGPNFNPTYLQCKRPGGEVVVLGWKYDPDTDTLHPWGD